MERPVTARTAGERHTVIEPRRGWVPLDFVELWEYRELLFFLTWRDIKVRYKQTALGIAWAVIQPVFTMLVFSIFFGALANVPSDGLPYPIFAFAALIPWTLFSQGVTQSASSLIVNPNLITRIYIPRILIPMASILGCVVDFIIAFMVFAVMMIYYQIPLNYAIVWLPFFSAMVLIASLGVGLWLSALNVRFRDIRYVIPFLLQLWLIATPIAYPTGLVPEKWRAVFSLNPMVGVIEGFRWALLGTEFEPGMTTLVSGVTAVVVLVSGIFYFRRTEDTFADVI